MADPVHLRVLTHGVPVWNHWRRDNPDLCPDLSQADLTWEDLRGADLSGANLRDAKLIRADLNRANLSGADLSGSDLSGAQGLTLKQIHESLGVGSARLPEALLRARSPSVLRSQRTLWGGILLLLGAMVLFHTGLRLSEKDKHVSNDVEAAPVRAAPKPNLTTASTPQPQPAEDFTAAELRDLSVSTGKNSLRIFAATSQKLTFSVFRLSDPNRVAIDLPGVMLSIARPRRTIEVAHPPLQRVRIEQHRFDPPLVRLVLDVSWFPQLEITPRSEGLEIVVHATSRSRSTGAIRVNYADVEERVASYHSPPIAESDTCSC